MNVQVGPMEVVCVMEAVVDFFRSLMKGPTGAVAPKATDAPAEAEATPKPKASSSDAQIDDFIEDIAPFFMKKKLTYVDAGAFVGDVFLKLLRSGAVDIREAHLFEPNPESFAELKRKVADCGISALHLYNLALGNDVGEKTFLAARSMTKSVKNAPSADGAPVSTNMFTAPCKPLQDFENFITDQHIHILKVDVEGDEMEVLAGARGLLDGMHVDVLYIEVGMNRDGTQQTYVSRIDGFLQDYGYRAFKIYEQRHEWIQDSPLLRRCNVAYMSSRCAANNPYSVVKENYLLAQEIERLKADRNRKN